MDVKLLPDAEIVARSGPALNPHLTLLVERNLADPTALRFGAADFGGAPHSRVRETIGYIHDLHGIFMRSGLDHGLQAGETLIFQTDDNTHDVPSASWERRRMWDTIRLVPDIYYYQARGYMDYLPPLPAWWARPKSFVWRGSTTGLPGFVADDLDRLPRYRLCRLAQEFGHADCAFTLAVQGRTAEDDQQMTERLQREELIRPYVSMTDMGASSRYIFDIDGNANSWNFMAKLRLGCCVLKVESEWEQWFQHRLIPWRHYVPVAADMDDLPEKMAWCLDNDRDAERIAAEGSAFAHAMEFDDEMARAANTLFGVREVGRDPSIR